MNVCKDQETFNDAFKNAVKAQRKSDDKKIRTPLRMYIITHSIFVLWAIVLAMNTSKTDQVLHLTMAIVFGPAYVMAYYISQLSK
jgi:hypothetical protein